MLIDRLVQRFTHLINYQKTFKWYLSNSRTGLNFDINVTSVLQIHESVWFIRYESYHSVWEGYYLYNLISTFRFGWHDDCSHCWWYRWLSCQVTCFRHWTHWCFSSSDLFSGIENVRTGYFQILGKYLSISADKRVLVELDKVICFTVDSVGNRQTWKTGGSISKSFCIVSRFLTNWSFKPKSTITFTQWRIASEISNYHACLWIFHRTYHDHADSTMQDWLIVYLVHKSEVKLEVVWPSQAQKNLTLKVSEKFQTYKSYRCTKLQLS